MTRQQLKARLRAVVHHSVRRDCSHQMSDQNSLALLVVVDVREHHDVLKRLMPVLHLGSEVGSTRKVQYGPQGRDHQEA